MNEQELKLINGSYPLRPTTIVVGNFGSGKTEVSVNFTLAVATQFKDEKVSIVDLDVVNPYFRCREAAEVMEAKGISVVYPKGEYTWADLPIILPEIKGLLTQKDIRLILDVGGDDVGAKALASLADFIPKDSYEMLFVLNPRRPFTGDAKGAMKIMSEIEAVSTLKITGFIVNTHLVDETTPAVILDGVRTARDVSKASGVPIKFISVMRSIISQMSANDIGFPVLPLDRLLLPPWKRIGRLSTMKIGI